MSSQWLVKYVIGDDNVLSLIMFLVSLSYMPVTLILRGNNLINHSVVSP